MLTAEDVYNALRHAQIGKGPVTIHSGISPICGMTTDEVMFFEEAAQLLSGMAREGEEEEEDRALQKQYDEGYKRGLKVGSENREANLREENPHLFEVIDEIDELKRRARMAMGIDELSVELRARHEEIAMAKRQLAELTRSIGDAGEPAFVAAAEAAS